MVPESKKISSFKLKNAFLLQQCYSFKDTLVPLPQVSPSLLTDTQRPTGELGGKKGAQGTPGALQGRARCERHQAGWPGAQEAVSVDPSGRQLQAPGKEA